MRRPRPPVLFVLVAASVGILAAACGVPKSSRITRVDQPIGLSTIPTTTVPPTTAPPSTAPPTTAVPTTTSPATVAPTAPATTVATTTAAPSTAVPTTAVQTTVFPTEDVQLYFITGGQLKAVTRALPKGAGPQQVLEALQLGVPPGDAGAGLRSAVPRDSIVGVTSVGGVANVAVVPNFSTQIPSLDQRLAIAQIVLSLRLPGIGQVTFSIDGAGINVPKGDGSSSGPGATVTFDDYKSLIVA